MDIAQAPNAVAVLTVGKDMTFRDYAQGAFRLRSIGKGQTLLIYLIPEVEQLIQQELLTTSQPVVDPQRLELAIPAWLLINAMKMATVQYCKLALQELHSIWRKSALRSLTQDVAWGLQQQASPLQRVQRFLTAPSEPTPLARTESFAQSSLLPSLQRLRDSIQQFREALGHPLSDELLREENYNTQLRHLVAANTAFVSSPTDTVIIATVLAKVAQVNTRNLEATALVFNGSLDIECVRENEVQTEAQVEDEATQEEQRTTAWARDDEQPQPWAVELLQQKPILVLGTDTPFYPWSAFQSAVAQPCMPWPANLLLKDNFFKPRWIGVGERRLKNAEIVMQWVPVSSINRHWCFFKIAKAS